MESRSHNLQNPRTSANPLNEIAANLGVTPKVLTQLATGDDNEFRELVRGIFSILPENEVLLVASDPEINPEFLNYLCNIFENNQKVLLTILQNPSSNKKTKQYILGRLPEKIVASLSDNPTIPLELRQSMTAEMDSEQAQTQQTEEFKIKMKVSRLLNDLEANLGLTIDAFLQIRSKHDKDSQEFVREVYNALPENNVLLVSRDPNTNPVILDYLSRLFDNNHKVLVTILLNPSSTTQTRAFIFNTLPERTILALAGNSDIPPIVLRLMGEHFTTSEDVLVALLANPATPLDAKEAIQSLSDAEMIAEDDIITDAEILEEEEEELPPLSDFSEIPAEDTPYEPGDIDAKIALCVDKLYDINAEIVTEFIKKARSEIIKRLNLMAKINRLLLTVIVKHESLSLAELEGINLEMFASLLKRLPKDIDEKTVLALLHQAKTKKKSSS